MQDRKVLGTHTYLVDAETGKGKNKAEESGKIIPSFARSEGFIEEPAKTEAKSKLKTVGIPLLRAKRNIEIADAGKKFSGIYYCESVRHTINESGYSCELKLKRNALSY